MLLDGEESELTFTPMRDNVVEVSNPPTNAFKKSGYGLELAERKFF